MSGTQPSITHDGTDVVVTSDETATLKAYQCVTAHANACVSDASSKTIIEYSSGKATLKKADWTNKGTVHIPIQNPPAMTLSPPATTTSSSPTIMSAKQQSGTTLQTIFVKFDSSNSGRVDTVTLYYDSKKIVATNVNKEATFYVEFIRGEPASYSYEIPTGICVELNLSFPNANSSITLYSVTLVYKQE